MSRDSRDSEEMLRRAAAGDAGAFEAVFEEHRKRLRRMAEIRISPVLRGRVDASDVIQESFLEAWRRLADYLHKPTQPFFHWLRFLVRQQLFALHRKHAGVKARDPRREVALYDGSVPEASSEVLASQLLGTLTSPSEAMDRAELQHRLQEGLDSLDPEEREILALRHFEQLTSGEAAKEIGITESAAAKRYLRALRRLKGLLVGLGFSPDALR
jgi:RNA polymerase sigma-70 factor (ECF subfamily)